MLQFVRSLTPAKALPSSSSTDHNSILREASWWGGRRVALETSKEYSVGVVTDLAEVFRLGTAKVKENVAFRRYLSARHYADKPFQILASEVQQ
jgi:hypothetical protein